MKRIVLLLAFAACSGTSSATAKEPLEPSRQQDSHRQHQPETQPQETPNPTALTEPPSPTTRPKGWFCVEHGDMQKPFRSVCFRSQSSCNAIKKAWEASRIKRVQECQRTDKAICFRYQTKDEDISSRCYVRIQECSLDLQNHRESSSIEILYECRLVE